MTGQRVTRTTVFCAFCAWAGCLFVTGTLAQWFGLWRWSPSPDAALAVVFLILAALVAVLFIPAEEVEEP